MLTYAIIPAMDTQKAAQIMEKTFQEVCRRFIGKEEQVKLALTAFFSGLHLLIEDRPGVGKTTLARCISKVLGLDMGRIQFTPDLLPGDITGMNIWDESNNSFHFSKGPVFHQFVLADELNRAAARTQSALLEAMQESQVTVDGTTYPLEKPFFVVATQNPSQYSGTFALPEAQLDRFGLSFSLDWPAPEFESRILHMYQSEDPAEGLEQSISLKEILEVREAVRKVSLSEKVSQWLVKLGGMTRVSSQLQNGFSTRGLQHLLAAAQGKALWDGRDFVIPEDVLELAPWVARHKLSVSPELRMENRQADFVLRHMLDKLEIPV